MTTQIDTTLSSDIHVITAEINTYKRIAGEAIFEIGYRLKEVRDNPDKYGFAGYRDWERWCVEEVDIPRRSANRFIQAYEELGSTSTRLSIGKVFEIISLPSDINRIDFVSKPHRVPSTGETKTVDEMTVRELREVKAVLKAKEEALKVAKERADRAEADYETIRGALGSKAREEPRIEYVSDPNEADRLRRYVDRFGDIETYESGTYRIPNVTDISASLQAFSHEVRALLKKYAYLTQYTQELAFIPAAVAQDHEHTVLALSRFVQTLNDDIASANRGVKIINVN